MNELFAFLVGDAAYMAHGYCLLWKPWLIVTHAGADAAIAAAYFAIPLAIFSFVRQRSDFRVAERRVALLFVTFILACGLTHLVGLATLWAPIYEIDGIVKVFTAVVSVATAFLVWRLLPHFLNLPSANQLALANARLEQEVRSHKDTLAGLEKARLELEHRVAERTGELAEAKRRLDSALQESGIKLFAQDSALRYTWAYQAPSDVSEQRYLGKTDEEVLRGPSAEEIAKVKRQVLSTGKSQTLEVELVEDSHTEWYRLRVDPYASEMGVEGVYCCAVNITKEKNAQNKLEALTARVTEALARFQTALLRSDIRVFEQDSELSYVWASGSLQGREPAEIAGLSDADLYPQDAARRLVAVKKAVLESKKQENLEFDVQTDTERIWYDLHLEPRLDPLGHVVGLTGALIDVSEQKRFEVELRILLREVTHRAKNLLAVVQAMARQTADTSDDIDSFLNRFERRLAGLSKSHDLLVEGNWRGVLLEDIVKSQLMHQSNDMEARIFTHGPKMRLDAAAAQNLGLAFHELGTNALKYGALSVSSGRVDVNWGYVDQESGEGGSNGDTVFVEWVESGGPEVMPPKTRGFGRTVIERIVSRGVGGTVDLDFAKEGLRWRLVFSPSEDE